MRSGLACGQLRNTLAQVGQARVDGNALFRPFSRRIGVLEALASGQICEMNFAVECHTRFTTDGRVLRQVSAFFFGGLEGGVGFVLVYVEGEDGMGSRGFGVDGGSICLSDFRSMIQCLQQLIHCLDFHLPQSSHNDLALVLSNHQRIAFVRRSRLRDQEISQSFVVNLNCQYL